MNEHSARFEKVKGYYDRGLWNRQMVMNAVGKWITAEEAEEILSGGNVQEIKSGSRATPAGSHNAFMAYKTWLLYRRW